MKIAVLGVGAWGTALAKVLHANGHELTLWAHNPDRLAEMISTGRNSRYLPDVDLPTDWKTEPDIQKAVAGCEAIVIAVASKAFRTVMSRLKDFQGLAITGTKGIEYDSGLTMSGVLRQLMPKASVAALSGPSLALEVARGEPSAVVIGAIDYDSAKTAQSLFHRPEFRVYTTNDILGVEMGGALKNVIAIAAGVGDGMGFGDNSKAALITRAIVEITRLGVAAGAKPETFSGLSGLGDLTVTCFSKLSRNRGFGERLGRGEQLTQVLLSVPNVAEGYPAACAAHQLAQKLKVSAPIIREVYSVLYEGKNAAKAVRDLMARESKPEHMDLV